jgi:hypothetical protein
VLLEIQLAQLEKELADRDLNVIALYGRESDPETAIRQRKSEHIVIAYDNDDEMRRMTRIGEYPHGFLFNAHHEPIAEFIGLPLAKIQPLINLVPKRKLTSKR